jgi:hypothetical protein
VWRELGEVAVDARRSRRGGLKAVEAEGRAGLVVLAAARDTAGVTLWLMIAAGFVVGVVAGHVVTVRRYFSSHVVGEVSVAGRGLFFSRTPDGIWWRVRLHARRCTTTYPAEWGDAPPDAGVREPRRPPGRGPLSAAAALEPPDC